MRKFAPQSLVPCLVLSLGCSSEPRDFAELDALEQIDDDESSDDEPAAPALPSGTDQLESDEDPVDVVTFCDPAIVPVIPIDFDRELVVRDLAVVEDACRTDVAPGIPCPPGTVGAWTFTELMAGMSGAVPVGTFVAEWLSTFETPTVVNGFPVPARPAFRPAFLDPWLVASGCAAGDPIVGAGACPLDLTIAPFRLLAIVNRIDLEDTSAGHPGELRFVFGATDPGGAALPATFIFEYELPTSLPSVDWANRLHDLSLWPLGSAPYRNHLQAITDDVIRPGVQPGNPNFGSAIGQVRTNDIAFGGPLWVMREYTLQAVGRGPNAFALRASTTAQNPDDSLNLTAALDGFLTAAEPQILNVDHVVPAGMLGGQTASPFLWDQTGGAPILPETRHLFGFATCNGCHTLETDTNFTHIDVRPAGAPAPLSGFMGVSPLPAFPGSGSPAAFFPVPDPAPSGLVFQYNEPWRRVCEMRRVLSGSPTPYTMPHGAH